MKKILVTGAQGQLGSELQVLAVNYSQFEWLFTDREELDLCNLVALETKLATISPQLSSIVVPIRQWIRQNQSSNCQIC